MILDAHTHNAQSTDAVINASPSTFTPIPNKCYTLGVHPWDTASCTDDDLAKLEALASHPQVVAIGETGLDPLQGADLDTQMRIFKQHIAIAERVQKPLIIHMVRTSQQVLKAWKESSKTLKWMIHGMRGNTRVAAPLIEAGFYFSFGERFNPETLKIIPEDHILIETDDSKADIHQVATKAADTLNISVAELEALASTNARNLFAL